MTTKAERERRETNARFSSLIETSTTHVRVGQGRNDGTRIILIGHALELHGLDGCCTCCPRRPAGEPTGRAQAIESARAAARAAAEAGPRPSSPLVVDGRLL